MVEDGELQEKVGQVAPKASGKIEVLVDPVILDLVSGKVVGTDLVGPHGLADSGTGCPAEPGFVLLFDLPEFGPEKIESNLAVLLLGALLTNGEGKAGGFV